MKKDTFKLFRFRHSNGKNSTPCRFVLSWYFFHTRDNSTLSCTDVSCIFLFSSLIIPMVCTVVYLMRSSHFASAFHEYHELQCSKSLCSEIWKHIACAFGKFRDRWKLDWTFGDIMNRLYIISLLYSATANYLTLV